MKVITAAESFDDVDVFEATDPYPGATSIEVPVQALTNRTEYLYQRFDEGVNWKELDVVATAPSSTTITTSSDYSDLVRIGQPIRIIEDTPFEAGASTGHVTYGGMTGVTVDTIDDRGNLYARVVHVMTLYTLSIYNKPSMSSASKVAHVSFSTTGVHTLTEDNSSGVAGTITVVSLSDQSNRLEYAKHGIISDIDDTTITIVGPAIDTSSNAIWRVDVANRARFGSMSFLVPGDYAVAVETDCLRDIAKTPLVWRGPPIRILQFHLWENAHDTSHEVNVTVNGEPVSSSNSDNGLTVSAAQTWVSTTTDLNRGNLLVETGDAIEVSTQQGNAAGGDQDLNVTIAFAFE